MMGIVWVRGGWVDRGIAVAILVSRVSDRANQRREEG